MSLNSLPILILNLGGEMFYILDQRLKAQNVPPLTANHVLNDVAAALFDEVFIHQIFEHQPLCTKENLYTLFQKIAHASIMKLNNTSMQKLFDLMMMVFKYHLYHARHAREILLITLNHLNSLHNLVTSVDVKKQLISVHYLFKKYYKMTDSELLRIRYDLLNYFQDMRIRVSILLRQGLQNNDGTFNDHAKKTIPHDSQCPGTIEIFNSEGKREHKITFPSEVTYEKDQMEPCYEFPGTTGISLGLTIYSRESVDQDVKSNKDKLGSNIGNIDEQSYRREVDTLKQELVGNRDSTGTSDETIALDVFTNTMIIRNQESSQKETFKVITLENEHNKLNMSLETAAAEVTIEENNTSNDNVDDLLYLLENI